MIFENFFLDYKINLKEIKGFIKFKDQLTYRKFFLVFFPLLLILFLISLFFKYAILLFSSIILISASTVIVGILDNKTENKKVLFKEHYLPNSHKRINIVLKLLDKYNINVDDIDTVEKIIDEARIKQEELDYLSKIKEQIKAISGFIGFFITPFIKEVVASVIDTKNLNLYFFTILSIFAVYIILLSLEFFIRDFFYRDYNKLNELILDLRQITIFYSNNKKNRQKLKKDIRKIKNTKSLKKVREIKIIISQ